MRRTTLILALVAASMGAANLPTVASAEVRGLAAVTSASYSPISCTGWFSAITAYDYLDLDTLDTAACAVRGMFKAANGYLPQWVSEPTYSARHGKIIVKVDGDCSPPADPDGDAYDFNIACKAHDFCYDLRKAGFSGTVTDKDCDDTFNVLMTSHCDSRTVNRGDCYAVRNIFYQGVTLNGPSPLPRVVTDPSPGIVEIQNRYSGKCADVEGPYTTDGTPIQQWTCLGVSNQRFRIWPDPGAVGRFNLEAVYPPKCARATTTVVISSCNPPWQATYLSFVIQGALNLNQYSLRSAFNTNRCWHVPGSVSDGVDLDNPTCDDHSNSYIWEIRDV